MGALRSRELQRIGWPKNRAFGLALEYGRELEEGGADRATIVARLEEVRSEPERFVDAGGTLGEIAAVFDEMRQAKERATLREEGLEAPVWGRELIDKGAVTQLEDAMRLPVAVAGALMPDAHVGYGLPIGGVVALEDAVAPYMVGVDIACRMMMTIYPSTFTESFRSNEKTRETVRKAIVDETRFGMGSGFEPSERRDHDVLDDEAWSLTNLLRNLKDRAHKQLGSSGTGNHFVDAGYLEVSEEGAAALGVDPGEYFALMSHSGSRGTGARICDHYAKLAQQVTPLEGRYRNLAWLPMESEAGQEYWESMNLAGRYASANHHVIHRALSRALGERPIAELENHHNFAWLEEHDGRKLYVHRKGATPASEGELGIVPGSMAHDSFIVRGKGNASSLRSASHGAGRKMSRGQAIRTLPKAERNRILAEREIELIGGGMDEAPMAYKEIEEVLALQSDLVETIARFRPKIVRMADDGKSEG